MTPAPPPGDPSQAASASQRELARALNEAQGLKPARRSLRTELRKLGRVALAGFALVIALILVVSGLALFALEAYQSEARIGRDAHRTADLHERLLYLDEVLTMSARMYAATGSPEFLARYLEHEGPLNDTIREMESVADDEAFSQALRLTDEANSALVLLEKRAIDLTGDGRGEEALALLVGAEYTTHKQVYRSGIDQALDDLQARQAASQDLLDTRVAYLVAGAVSLGLVSLLLGAFLLLRAARARSRRLAEAAAAELARVRQVSDFKTEFLNNAAHELSTPITPIKLQMATMRRGLFGELKPEQARAMDLLERNLSRLARLVQDLLEAARVQSGKLRLAKVPVPLAEAAAEVVASFEAKAREDGVTLELSRHAGDVTAMADPVRLNQVLFNLVHNALKFTPRGGRVVLGVRGQGDDAVIEVSDSGIGLAPEQIDRMFQPFTQVHAPGSLPTSVGGTGLGLYISRGIVEQHGGLLDVVSGGPGRGSTFRVTMPRLREAPMAVASGARPTAA